MDRLSVAVLLKLEQAPKYDKELGTSDRNSCAISCILIIRIYN